MATNAHDATKQGEKTEENGIEAGKFEELSGKVEQQQATLETIQNSMEELRKSSSKSADNNEEEKESGRRELESKMSQLDDATTQVKSQLIKLQAETKIAIEDVKTELADIEKPMRMETLVRNDTLLQKKADDTGAADANIVSHEADIADLYAKIEAMEEKTVKETQNFKSEIKNVHDKIETRFSSFQTSQIQDDSPKEPGASVEKVNEVEEKID